MKKILQTCFLALLCLVGRYLIAQSKVVRSPGAELIHRSDSPNRGGAILPDIFHQLDNGAEIPSPSPHGSGLWTVDGGPILPSHVSPHSGDTHRGGAILPDTYTGIDFGLVDSDQDMGAGEQTYNLDSAPVTVSPPLDSQISNPPNQLSLELSGDEGSKLAPHSSGLSTVDSGLYLPSSVSGLPSNHPTSQGQEQGNTPARPEEQFLTLRFELNPLPNTVPQSLKITLSTQELDDRYDYLSLLEDSLSLASGQFLDGTTGLWTGETRIPFQLGVGRLKINLDDQSIIQNIWIQPGDSLRLSFDQSSGKVIFLGPDKDKFRLQLQLQDLASAWINSINPIMITSGSTRILDTPEKESNYQKIVENHSKGWNRKMELLIDDSQRLNRAKFLLNSVSHDHSVFVELKRYQDLLESEFYDWLWLYWKGKLRMQALDFMVLTKASSNEWGQLLLENSLDEGELNRIRSAQEFPLELLESLYVENYLLQLYSGISFTHLTETLPQRLQNQVNALFLVRQYKDLPDADQLISDLMGEIDSPWTVAYLGNILTSNLKGREFMNQPFWDEYGEQVYPKSWNGKLVFLDFWLSGCGACIAFARNKFIPLVEEFGENPDILFITITGDSDPELWKSTLAKNHFTSSNTIDLFAGGVTHPALKQYHIQAFPEQLLLDREGKILQTGDFPPTLEGWRQLILTYLNLDNMEYSTLTQPQSN